MVFHCAFCWRKSQVPLMRKKEVSSPAFHMCGCAFYSFIFLICATETDFIDLISLYRIINVRARRSLNVSHLFAAILLQWLLWWSIWCFRICLCCFVAKNLQFVLSRNMSLALSKFIFKQERKYFLCFWTAIFGSCGEDTGKVGQQGLWPFFLQDGFSATKVSWRLMSSRPSCLLIFTFSCTQ